MKQKSKKSFSREKKLRLLNFFSFLLGFQMIMVNYLFSSVLKNLTGKENVGIFFMGAYFVSLLLMFNLHFLVKRFGKGKVFISSVFLKFLALLGVVLLINKKTSIIFIFFSIILGPIMWVGLDWLIETFSFDKITGTIRGKFLTIMNLGCFLAPYATVFLMEQNNDQYWPPFLFAALIVFFVFLFSFGFFWKVKNDFRKKIYLKGIIKKIYQDKDLRLIYLTFLLLDLFYASMIIFLPLFLYQKGFGWSIIGKILTIMLIPFVLIQYPLGVIADKKKNEKDGIIVGFFIMAISCLFLVLLKEGNFLYFALVLFISRIGGASVEVLANSYFFKKVSAKDIDIIDFFRTTRNVAYILIGGFSSLILIFFPIETIFIFLSFLIFLGIFPLLQLKKLYF